MIDGATRLLAIVGDPVRHARSPVVINRLLALTGSNAVLVPWHVRPEAFDGAVQGLKQTANLLGFVVTYPYKYRAISLADRLQPIAARVGAVNALRRDADGSWTGGMFDGAGLVKAAEGLSRPVAGRAVALLGAGGAGAAIAHALAEAGVARLSIFDLDGAKAEALVAAVGADHPSCAVTHSAPALDGADLLVNATPVGMEDGDALPGPMSCLTAATTVIDIVPRAGGTPLLALARERGCPNAGGAAMVEGQATVLIDFFGLAAGDRDGDDA